MPSPKRFPLALVKVLLACLMVGGCAAPYGISYRPILDPNDERLLEGKSIEHEWVDNMLEESMEMHGQGYAMVGYSYMCGAHFTGVAPAAAKNWGRSLRAEKVSQYNNGCIYLATYWRRIRGFNLGAYYEDAPTPAHEAFGIDAGVIVQNVAAGTPADLVQLSPGDLLLAIDDEIIPNALWLDQALTARRGREITLTIWPMRDVEPVTISLNLYGGGAPLASVPPGGRRPG